LGTRQGLFRTQLVGVYTLEGAAATSESAMMLMPLRAAQLLFRAPRKVDSAQIVLKQGEDEKAARAAIEKVLPTGLTVQRPAARNPVAEETSLSTELGMRMARAFSLLVATFIITNTFLINVAQRRRQLGIMRAIGATQGQVTRMVYREAIIMGLMGTVFGSLLGIIAARYLNAAMSTLYRTKLPPIELQWTPFLIATACGLGISLLAAALPARKASRLSPLEAMRDVLPEEIEGTSWLLMGFGLVIAIVGGSIMAASILGWLPMFNAVWAAILLLIGLALLLPVVLRPFSSLTAALMRPFAAVEGRLARLQLLRHRSRTTLTVGVIFIAISTGIGLASSVIDNVNNVKDWYRKTIVADFFVRAMAPDMASGLAADLPDSIGPKLEKIPGIENLDALRFVSVKAAGERAILVARDHSSEKAPDLDVVEGDISQLRQQFREGQVALGSVLAQQTNLKVGDNITLETDQGKKEFRIAAIVNDYQAGGLTIHIEREVAKRELGIDGVDAYIVTADPKQIVEVRNALQTVADEYRILLQTSSEIRQTIDGMMSGVVAALWGMVVLALGVASIGVTNTLTINVLEQTRELGLLRAVAMTQQQARKTILSQAMIMALLALVPGVFAGVAIAYLINLATLPVTGHAVEFRLHPSLLVGSLVAGVIVVVLAAWVPANRAARLDLPETLRMA
jgi:putative ABC transport system permease protein